MSKLNNLHRWISTNTGSTAIKTSSMMLGVVSAALSLECFMLGISTLKPVDIISTNLPGGESRLEQEYASKRWLPKWGDDGANVIRILPTPALHWVGNRFIAMGAYGPLGVMGDASPDAVRGYLEANLDPSTDPDIDAALAHIQRHSIGNWFKSAPIPEGSWWKSDVWMMTLCMVLFWRLFQGGQSFVWRNATRSIFLKMFKEANAVKKIKADKDSLAVANSYAVMHNRVDQFKFIGLLILLGFSYYVEFRINGPTISKKLYGKSLLDFMALFGFEASNAIVEGLETAESPTPRTPQHKTNNNNNRNQQGGKGKQQQQQKKPQVKTIEVNPL